MNKTPPMTIVMIEKAVKCSAENKFEYNFFVFSSVLTPVLFMLTKNVHEMCLNSTVNDQSENKHHTTAQLAN